MRESASAARCLQCLGEKLVDLKRDTFSGTTGEKFQIYVLLVDSAQVFPGYNDLLKHFEKGLNVLENIVLLHFYTLHFQAFPVYDLENLRIRRTIVGRNSTLTTLTN